MSEAKPGLLLRFRDLVTEPGGNIREHRQIISDLGFAWWGWWARSQELVPNDTFAQLLSGGTAFPAVLFDSGLMEFYYASCSKVAISPAATGIASPDFRATPHYYVRGNYPAWFKIHGALDRIGPDLFSIVGRPTGQNKSDDFEEITKFDAEDLRKEDPTLWSINYHGPDHA